MNYLPKNKLKHLYFKRILILATIFILGAITFSLLDSVIISATSSLWKSENVVIRKFQNLSTLFSSQKKLWEENTLLKEKVSSLELTILSLSGGQTQEDILLELASQKQGLNTVISTVLTQPPQSPYDTIIIDAGSRDSITLGSVVSLPEGPILGRVSEIFTSRAKVKLLSSNGEETSAVLERGNVPVTLIGAGGGNFKIVLPHDITVEKEDRILSADITSRLVAIVGEINVSPTDSFKEVLAKSPTNIFSLRFVFVTP